MSHPPESSPQAAAPLALPSKEDAAATKVEVDAPNTVKLDHLGPIVVNSDGTLARVPNWHEMTKDEQERTTRILAKRNQARLEKLRGDVAPPSS
ncbi:uncharacterized protein MJAP1_001153 [Malassezia japonica]|uniref:Uncharacterized protein n=1 Tax=Malassezia japonica TaxID=223818 RepID=A0AAF0J9I8_9BASI|nr:uncharacterized protein MJAP1_001153 [Malassezia japonica]WFD38205.1 hypothetical protein MJAP1_001153 [Malassezia japonica]